MNKVHALIGLAKRAGKVVSGESAAKDSIRFGKACIAIIAEDASDNTKKSITNSCKYYEVKYYIWSNKNDLGHALGNNFNAVVCITDHGFAKSIEQHLQANTNGGE